MSDLTIISRSDARAAGLVFFYTGAHCCYDHPSPRYVCNGKCLHCRRMFENSRIQADPERHREKGRASYWRNPAAERQRVKNYRAKNPQHHRAKSREWVAANPERHRENARNWRLAHPETMRVYASNRRARKLQAGGSFTCDDVAEIIRSQKGKCAYCRCKLSNYHIDHIMPLARGGRNDRRNIQVVCPPCNQQKQARDPIEFASSRGMLL